MLSKLNFQDEEPLSREDLLKVKGGASADQKPTGLTYCHVSGSDINGTINDCGDVGPDIGQQ